MLLLRGSSAIAPGLKSQLILPGTLSGAGLTAIHLLGGSAPQSLLNLAPPQSGAAALQGASVIGAVNFSNANYALFPGNPGGSGQAPAILSPYLETNDITLCMAVKGDTGFVNTANINYARCVAGDPAQPLSVPGTQVVCGTQLSYGTGAKLSAASNWGIFGTSAAQTTSGQITEPGDTTWKWIMAKVTSGTRTVAVKDFTNNLVSSAVAAGSNPRVLNTTVTWNFGGWNAANQNPIDIAAIVLFSRALSSVEDTLLYTTMQGILLNLKSITI